MPLGYVTRFKGKIAAQRIDVGLDGIRQYVLNSSAATSTVVPPQLQNAGLSVILAGSSGSPVFSLEAPVPGIEKQITLTTASSGAFILSTAATFDGTNPVLKFASTLGSVAGASVNLLGISTSRWAIVGAFPSSVALLSATT